MNRYKRMRDQMVPSEAAQMELREKIEAAQPVNWRGVRRRALAAAACLLLVTAAACAVPSLYGIGRMKLPQSDKGIRVRYVYNPPISKAMYDLVSLTEEEIFQGRNGRDGAWENVIFYGEVKKIRNIVLDFRGASLDYHLDYQAIAEIEVREVYRGDIAPGDVISVLLPCPIGKGVWVEDTGVISQLREGMTGIFMPIRYSETDCWEENGVTLILRDVAGYGLPDGERYAFLETPGGLAYAGQWAFPSLPENAALEDVKALIAAYAD